MAETTFRIRMDDSLMEHFDALCTDLGMSASTTITVFAKAVVRERRIPFTIFFSTAPDDSKRWSLRLPCPTQRSAAE